MGQIYAGHLARRVPQARLVAVADVIEERARTLADDLGADSWSTDYREVLADSAVRAVSVTSPTSTHREVVIAAAEAGMALFCNDREPAVTRDDARAALEIALAATRSFQEARPVELSEYRR